MTIRHIEQLSTADLLKLQKTVEKEIIRRESSQLIQAINKMAAGEKDNYGWVTEPNLRRFYPPMSDLQRLSSYHGLAVCDYYHTGSTADLFQRNLRWFGGCQTPGMTKEQSDNSNQN